MYEDAAHAYGAQERSDIRDVLARAPVYDVVNPRGVRKSSFWCATMPDHGNLFRAQYGLEAAECASAVFDALYDVVEALEMFPDKAADSWVLRDPLLTSVWEQVLRCRSTDRNIVDIRDCGFWDLRL